MTEEGRRNRVAPKIEIEIHPLPTVGEQLERFKEDIQKALTEVLRPDSTTKVPHSEAGERLLTKMFEESYERIFGKQPFTIKVIVEK